MIKKKTKEFRSQQIYKYIIVNLILLALIIKFSIHSSDHRLSAILLSIILFLLLIYGVYLIFDFILVIPTARESLRKICVGSGLLLSLLILTYANLFFQIYRIMGRKAFRFSGDGLSGDDFLYYSITTFTTTGYGDITPVGVLSNLIAASEMLLGMIVNTIFLAVVTSKLLYKITEEKEREKR